MLMLISNRLKKALKWPLIWLLGSLLGALFFEHTTFFQLNPTQSFNQFESEFIDDAKDIRKKVELALTSFAIEQKDCRVEYSPEITGTLYDESFSALYFFEDGRSIWWTDQRISVDDATLKLVTGFKLITLKSGKYLAYGRLIDNKQVVGLSLIEQHYSYQNDFLVNGFKIPVYLPEGSKLSVVELPDYKAISLFGQPILWLYIPPFTVKPNWTVSFSHVCWVLFIVMLFLMLNQVIQNSKRKKRALLLICIFLIAIRSISFYFKKPSLLYETPLFSPENYASSAFLPSLGDLFFNLIILSFIVIHLSKQFSKFKFFTNKYARIVYQCLFPLFLFIPTSYLFSLCNGIFYHSNISLDTADFLSINYLGYIAFLCIGLVFYVLFQITNLLLKWWQQSNGNIKWLYIQLLIGSILTQLAFQKFEISLLFSHIFLIGLVFIMLWSIKKKTNTTISQVILLVSYFSLIGTYILHEGLKEREEKRRENLAMKISEERDPIAESIFVDAKKNILSDTLVKKYLMPGFTGSKNVIDLGQRFFTGYWEKYSINFHVFGNDDCALSMAYTGSDVTPFRIDREIDSLGLPTADNELFFINNASGKINYVAKLNVTDQQDSTKTLGILYIEFTSRFTPEELGYPELLLDKISLNTTDISMYQVARYKFGQLVSKYGTFNYLSNDSIFKTPSPGSFSWMRSDGYKHLIYSADNTLKVVVTTGKPSLLSYITPFSYLALFFGLALSLIHYKRIYFNLKNGFTFKRRVQLGFVAILLFTVLLIGAGSIFFIINQNVSKNYNTITEKSNSVAVSLAESKMIEKITPPYNLEEFDLELKQLAEIFFTDINVYDSRGELFISSQPKIFEEGLLSRYIHPAALAHLRTYPNSEFINQERIGNLSYISAYVPLFLPNGEVNGYLNLPFFARQNEFRKEVTQYVTTIVNTNLFLVVLVFIASILLANTVTGPLQLIKEKLSKVKLGKKNEIIQWSGNDEIADLIDEYNRLIGELSYSADRLARSERESAWREMAKQVAHEIKNPLTPMKLSVQLLQRAWQDKAPDWEQRLERFSQTLIEQIEALSHIATEFSNFAKMPTMKKEQVDILALIHNAIDFHQNPDGALLSFVMNSKAPCLVNTDREQMLRVFNNLIKNALQAIEKPEDGVIEITLAEDENAYEIYISDNGAGISEELKEKIFDPNFTTKKSGMGLGLALVKNIVEASSGKISFVSELNKGTTFIIQLPKAHT